MYVIVNIFENMLKLKSLEFVQKKKNELLNF